MPGAGSSAEALEDVKALNMAVTGAGLEDSIRRGRLLAAQAEAKLAEAQQASDTSKVRSKQPCRARSDQDWHQPYGFWTKQVVHIV